MSALHGCVFWPYLLNALANVYGDAMTDPVIEAFEKYYESHFKSRLYMNMARTEWAFWNEAWQQSRREALKEAAHDMQDLIDDETLHDAARKVLIAIQCAIRAAAEEVGRE